MHYQAHDAAVPQEGVMGVARDAGAMAVSALSARLTGATGAVAPPPPTFNRAGSGEVFQLKQPDTFDASELLFVGLCSVLKPVNV